jgi:hypothetical protein
MDPEAQQQYLELRSAVQALILAVGYTGTLTLLAADARARAEAGHAPEATGDLLELAGKLDDLARDVGENTILP